MAEATVDQVECGFCVTRLEDLEDSRSLPCTHVHCLRCLLENFEVNKIVRCPFCREVFDVELESLPTPDTKEPPLCCDSCTRKGVDNQLAVVYCTTCSTKLCAKHREFHDEVHDNHPMVKMTNYRAQVKRVTPRLCAQHEEMAYTLSCKNCLTVACTECVEALSSCTHGSAHDLLSLDDLVTKLSKEMEKLTSEMLDKENKLSGLFKRMTGILGDYDSETRDMIETLHRTRDEQIQSIRLKYKKLEEELIESRRNTKLELQTLTEQDVEVKLSDLIRLRLQMEARLSNSHQVDLISSYKETENVISQVMSENVSLPEVPSITTLQVKDERREIEVEVVTSQDGQTTPNALHKQLILQHTAKTSGTPVSVCSYQGKVYVGSYGGVEVVAENKLLSEKLICPYQTSIYGIAAHRDRLYISIHQNSNYLVAVYNLAGKQVFQWNHNGNGSKLVVVGDQIVVPDTQNKILTLYSLSGEAIKQLRVPISNNYGIDISICAIDNSSVIISDHKTAKVFKVNISSGEVEWTSEHIANPQGVAYHRGRVLVADRGARMRISVLDVATGEPLTVILDADLEFLSEVYNFHVTGNTLIVPGRSKQEVLFYHIC